MTNIYIGNLSYRTTESELRELFGQYGSVKSTSIVKDRDTNRSKGFGFVEMHDAAEAQKAIEALNDKEVGGRPLRVNESRPREDRPQQGFGGQRRDGQNRGGFNRGGRDGGRPSRDDSFGSPNRW